jgi:hypothetical protein
MSTSSESESFDPSRRRLCPDGACIGLLDDSGRCRECGLQAGQAGPADAPTAPPDLESDGQPDLDEQDDELEAADEPGGGFDAKRRLCPDGDCLGVIGADGRCSVCGRTEAR